MSWKSEVGSSLADSLLVEHASIYELDSLKQLINWVRVEEALPGIYNSKTGNPSDRPLMLFKILLLQSWYKLSPCLQQID